MTTKAVRRFIALERLRDQRTVVSLLSGMRAAPLHRSCPDRYPAPAAASQWLDASPLLCRGQKYLEVTRHGDTTRVVARAVAG